MQKADDGTIGFSSVHSVVIGFNGIFQCRLSTDSDPSSERRGKLGWTFAYEEEPDLDRIIRFNNPVSPRRYSEHVGVTVSYVTIDGKNTSDQLIGQAVNLSKDCFFDGSRNMPGRELLTNFGLHVGNNNEYISGETSIVPQGTGIGEISPQLKIELGLESEAKFAIFKKNKIQLLESSSSIIDQKRLENLDKSFSYYFMTRLVKYSCHIDKNLYLNPQDSEVVNLLKEKNLNDVALNADCYSFDGDELTGHITGGLSFVYK